MSSSPDKKIHSGIPLPLPAQRPLLSVEEGRQILGISRSTMYRRIADGTIPVVRLGPRSTRIPTAELLALLGLKVDSLSVAA